MTQLKVFYQPTLNTEGGGLAFIKCKGKSDIGLENNVTQLTSTNFNTSLHGYREKSIIISF